MGYIDPFGLQNASNKKIAKSEISRLKAEGNQLLNVVSQHAS